MILPAAARFCHQHQADRRRHRHSVAEHDRLAAFPVITMCVRARARERDTHTRRHRQPATSGPAIIRRRACSWRSLAFGPVVVLSRQPCRAATSKSSEKRRRRPAALSKPPPRLIALRQPDRRQRNQQFHPSSRLFRSGGHGRCTGGEHVAVTTLVGPNGDGVYQPVRGGARERARSSCGRPAVRGQASTTGSLDFAGTRVVATTGIELIADDDHGDEHAETDHDHDDTGEASMPRRIDHDRDDHGDEHAEAATAATSTPSTRMPGGAPAMR